MSLSNIAQTIPASPIRELVPYAEQAKKRGIHVYHLNIGDPDIKTPVEMVKVLTSWKANPIGYAHSQGTTELISAMQHYYHTLGFSDIEEENIQITFGGSEGLMWIFMSICNPGDEIIVFEPFYTNYNSYAIMTHAKLVPILTTIESGFHLPTAKEIEKKITKKTKALLICNPGNPTGVVYTKKEMDMLVSIAKKYNLYLVSDEVYREFVYTGQKAISALSYTKSHKKGIIVCDSLSKRYSLCGIRIGAIVSHNTELMQACLRYGQARLSAGIVDQAVSAQLTKVPKKYFQEVQKEYKRRRDTLVGKLQNIDGVVCPVPEGAFYIIVKLPVDDSFKFAKFLLSEFEDNKETVMVAPAAGFYKTKGLGTQEIRIAYVLNTKAIKRSAEILDKALQAYKKKR